MITVNSVTRTCSTCPSQWEGTTDDGREIYVRFRWGTLWIACGEDAMKEYGNGNFVFCDQIGDGFDGKMSFDELKKLTSNLIQWPEHEKDES